MSVVVFSPMFYASVCMCVAIVKMGIPRSARRLPMPITSKLFDADEELDQDGTVILYSLIKGTPNNTPSGC